MRGYVDGMHSCRGKFLMELRSMHRDLVNTEEDYLLTDVYRA